MSLLRLPSFFSPNNVSMNLLRNCLVKQINATRQIPGEDTRDNHSNCAKKCRRACHRAVV